VLSGALKTELRTEDRQDLLKFAEGLAAESAVPHTGGKQL
jgi:hypothetical protein